MIPAIVFLFIGLVVAAIVLGAVSAAKRRKALAAWATRSGLVFDQGKRYGLDKRFSRLKCLHEGDDRYAFNTLTGHWQERPFLGFDYHYETHSTDSKGNSSTTNHYFSAVILESPIPLKDLFIRPEGFFDKIGDFFGFNDIDFESAEFSRRFFVKASDKRWAYDVIHARAMEFLMSRPTFSIQFDLRHVIIYRGKRFRPEEFATGAEVITGLLDMLPDYVVRQQTEGA